MEPLWGVMSRAFPQRRRSANFQHTEHASAAKLRSALGGYLAKPGFRRDFFSVRGFGKSTLLQPLLFPQTKYAVPVVARPTIKKISKLTESGMSPIRRRADNATWKSVAVLLERPYKKSNLPAQILDSTKGSFAMGYIDVHK